MLSFTHKTHKYIKMLVDALQALTKCIYIHLQVHSYIHVVYLLTTCTQTCTYLYFHIIHAVVQTHLDAMSFSLKAEKRHFLKCVYLLPVTQQCSMELRLSQLPSLDADVFSCESTPEWSLTSSTKGSPPPPTPTKCSVNIWTGLAFLSRMCQGTGGRGLQVSGTKVFSILKPFKVAKALVYLKRREKQKKK